MSRSMSVYPHTSTLFLSSCKKMGGFFLVRESQYQAKDALHLSLSVVLLNEKRDCSSPLVEYAHTVHTGTPHNASSALVGLLVLLPSLLPSFPPLSCLLHFSPVSRRRVGGWGGRGTGERERKEWWPGHMEGRKTEGKGEVRSRVEDDRGCLLSIPMCVNVCKNTFFPFFAICMMMWNQTRQQKGSLVILQLGHPHNVLSLPSAFFCCFVCLSWA